MFVGKLDNSVLERAHRFKKLVRMLQVQRNSAVFKLVEGRVVRFVYCQELLFHSLEFVLRLRLGICNQLKLVFELGKITRAAFDILLSF